MAAAGSLGSGCSEAVLGCLAWVGLGSGVFTRGSLTQAEGTEGRGQPVGHEAERGPRVVCKHQGLRDNDAERGGGPCPRGAPLAQASSLLIWAFYFIYYSLYFWVTFYFQGTYIQIQFTHLQSTIEWVLVYSKLVPPSP